jgi:hypothetical protein
MTRKIKLTKRIVANKKSQPSLIVSLTEDDQHYFSANTQPTIRQPQQGVQFKWNDDGSTSAGQCATTATQAQVSYRSLLPEFHQARTFVIRRAKMGKTPTPSQLREHLKGTKLSTCADDDDLASVIVTCSQTDERLPRPEKLTRTFLVDKMGLTPKTLKSYFSRVEKEPQAKK